MTRKFLRPAPFTHCLTFLLILLSLSVLTQAQSSGVPARGDTAPAAPTAGTPQAAPEQNVTAGAAETKDSNAKDSKDSVLNEAGAAPEASPSPSPTPTPEVSDPAAGALIEAAAMSDTPA